MGKNSIYRGWRALPWDVQHQDVTVRGPYPAKREDKAGPDFNKVRRASPANKLLPRTVDWLLALPPPVRPHLLAAKYARIANQLCLDWNDPVACRLYFADLLTDNRGGRRGFPMTIAKELQALRRNYAKLTREPDDRWQDGVRRLKVVGR